MRVAVVGCGRHAQHALYPSLAPAGLELAAVCARSMVTAEDAARRFGAPAAFDDVSRMLEQSDVSGVIVAVPAAAYRDVVLTAVQAGMAVFCEKPGGAGVEDLRRVREAARHAGVPLLVGYMKRFASAYQAAHAAARAADFGVTTSVHMQFVVGPGFGSLRGYIVDNAAHALDLLRWFGGDVAELRASSASQDDDRHAVALSVRFETGAVGTAQLASTASFFQHNERLDVIGNGCSLTVDNVDTLTVRPPRGPVAVTRPTYTVPLPANFTGTTMGFIPELAHFAEVACNGTDVGSPIGIDNALATMELVERVCAELGVNEAAFQQ